MLAGLLIKSEHLDKILAGDKTWEMRGSGTSRRGMIALIESGSGTVVGTCEVVDSLGPLSVAELNANRKKAGFTTPVTSLYYARTHAWVLDNARRLPEPVPYAHPSGAVIWVKLSSAVEKRVREQCSLR